MSDAPHPRTLTHAKLRRAQGDTHAAIAILEALIDAGEEGDELWQLYLALGGETPRPYSEEVAGHREPRSEAAAADLAGVFRRALGRPARDPRVERLEGWLDRIRRRNP